MSTTPNINLTLAPSSEWTSTYYRDYIRSLSGDDGTSNMQKIDLEFGDIISSINSMTTFLQTI